MAVTASSHDEPRRAVVDGSKDERTPAAEDEGAAGHHLARPCEAMGLRLTADSAPRPRFDIYYLVRRSERESSRLTLSLRPNGADAEQ